MHEETKLVKNVRLPRAKWHKLCYSEILDLEEINKNGKEEEIISLFMVQLLRFSSSSV